MTELGTAMIVLAIQITLPIVAGLLLSRQRDPAIASGALVCAIIAVLILTPLSFLPRPTFARDVLTSISDEPRAAEVPSIEKGSDRPAGINVFELLNMVPTTPREAEDHLVGWNYWRILAIALIAFVGFSFVRFVAMLVAVHRITSRSLSLENDVAMSLLAQLQSELGFRRRICLRESTRIGSAATVGWLRPIILLSTHWRSWTQAELRAVLAHEVVHVMRNDYLTRLLARFSLAIHGYHPLLRWMVARLELQQEIAADALAAKCCGGRIQYLKTFAATALKADNSTFGTVPTFLSRPRTLLRRIRMLHVKDDARMPTRRWPTIAIVAIFALAALGLHGTTQSALAYPIEQTKQAELKRVPLDIGYVPESTNKEQVGVFAVRVRELMQAPCLEKVSVVFAKRFDAILGKKRCFDLKSIEQIAGRVSLKHEPEKPAPNHTLMMSLSTVRMCEDFDWSKALPGWCSDWKEHTHSGSKYYSGKPKADIPILGPNSETVWFYQPDARTLVLESQEFIEKLIDAKGKPRPVTREWEAVSGGMIAVQFSQPTANLGKQLQMEGTGEKDGIEQELRKAASRILLGCDRVAFGIDVGAKLEFRFGLHCGSSDYVDAIAKATHKLEPLIHSALCLSEDPTVDPHGRVQRIINTETVNRSLTDIDLIIDFKTRNNLKELFEAKFGE